MKDAELVLVLRVHQYLDGAHHPVVITIPAGVTSVLEHHPEELVVGVVMIVMTVTTTTPVIIVIPVIVMVLAKTTPQTVVQALIKHVSIAVIVQCHLDQRQPQPPPQIVEMEYMNRLLENNVTVDQLTIIRLRMPVEPIVGTQFVVI